MLTQENTAAPVGEEESQQPAEQPCMPARPDPMTPDPYALSISRSRGG